MKGAETPVLPALLTAGAAFFTFQMATAGVRPAAGVGHGDLLRSQPSFCRTERGRASFY
jgi:hypothetical protein